VESLPIVEPLANETKDVRDGLWRTLGVGRDGKGAPIFESDHDAWPGRLVGRRLGRERATDREHGKDG